MTGSVGGQTAADPDHRTAYGTADAPLRLPGCDQTPLPSRRALFAPALPIELNVIWVDQHLEITSFPIDLSAQDGLTAAATRSAISGANGT